MASYLEAGWYTRKTPRRLRNEVIDGAVDMASKLFQANVEAQALAALALRVRGLAFVSQPHDDSSQNPVFDANAQEAMANQLALTIGPFPELESFARDCLLHVHNPGDLRAFYLHLLHIAQVMQLLAAAGPVESTG